MQQAINMAKLGLGNVGDNPTVGCIIVANKQIIGRGFTQKDGRHAEVMALLMAKKVAPNSIKNATIYVTLEPCAHFGRTPPCAEAIVKAQIAKVHIAVIDPDPRVSGQGIHILTEAGISVETGLLEQQAKQVLLGFLSRIQTQKPYVMLKLAMSQEGYIVRADGTSKWITSPQSRKYTHLLRAQHDAILIGIETALADDPTLNCRLIGLENRSPTRVILDSKLRIKVNSNLVDTANDIPTIIFTCVQADSLHEVKIKALEANNIQIQYVKKQDEHIDLNQVLITLAKLGINRLMVEGGAKVASSFVKLNLIDELNLFFAPEIIGKNGKPAIEMGIEKLLNNKCFVKVTEKRVDVDRFEQWQRPSGNNII